MLFNRFSFSPSHFEQQHEYAISDPHKSFQSCLLLQHAFIEEKRAATWENRIFAYAKTKTQISFAVTAKLISAFVFATPTVQSLSFLNTKFQASSHFLRRRSLVCEGPGRKPRRPVFWRRGSRQTLLHAKCSVDFYQEHYNWATTSETGLRVSTGSPHKSGCAASENG